ncbi:MAG TPA: branched-chain amino acid ABC transporter permease [Thermoplasmata archaeon]|nr:branched-chain amino acid ABC transporter permease [Thermoplasmata archaeon]HLA47475.1 branched-chain amino acid ABC transporter permease [Thermoplasmata archaeon]
MPVDLAFLLPLLGTTFGIFLILALSFNIEYGYAGQPNLGKVFFYSIGGYVAGALTTHALWALAGSPADVPFLEDAGGAVRFAVARANPAAIVGLFIASLALAALVGAAFGWLTSYPALRLRGDFLAIVLIAVGEASRVFVLNYEPIAGGVFGLSGVPNPFAWLPPRVVDAVYAVLVLVIAFGLYVFAIRLTNSPFGRLLKSLRDDELASGVYGKDTPKVKARALMIGSGMAGIAGALYVFYVQNVYAADFIPIVSFLAVTMVIVGGVANHKGTLVGAAFMTFLDLVTRPVFPTFFDIYWRPPFDMNYVRYLTIGVIIIVVLMFRPQGLLPERPVETSALKVARRRARPSPSSNPEPEPPGRG